MVWSGGKGGNPKRRRFSWNSMEKKGQVNLVGVKDFPFTVQRLAYLFLVQVLN